MSGHLFDVKLFASIRVEAATEAEARTMLEEALSCASANLGAWPDGSPILCEASIDGHPDLIETAEQLELLDVPVFLRRRMP